MSEEKNNTPVIRISLQVGIGEARALSFETYVDLGAKKEFICAILDTLNYCADRSKAKYDVEVLEKQSARGLPDRTKAFAEIPVCRRRGPPASSFDV